MTKAQSDLAQCERGEGCRNQPERRPRSLPERERGNLRRGDDILWASPSLRSASQVSPLVCLIYTPLLLSLECICVDLLRGARDLGRSVARRNISGHPPLQVIYVRAALNRVSGTFPGPYIYKLILEPDARPKSLSLPQLIQGGLRGHDHLHGLIILSHEPFHGVDQL